MITETRATVVSTDELRPARIAHIPALDGLRGLAVAGVLLYHGSYLTGGYLGVDLFFVLSGFLITSLLLVEHGDRGSISLSSFWSRRARRLLPALYLFLVGIAGYCLLWARPVDLAQIRGDVGAALLYISNWWNIAANTDYWSIALAPSPLQHLWSLAIEEQFYVVWPLVVVAATRGRSIAAAPVRVLTGALAGAALSVLAFTVLHAAGASVTRLYEGTDTRAFALLCGAALAGWWRIDQRRVQPRNLGRTALATFGPLAVLLLGLAWFRLDGRSGFFYAGGMHACSVLATVVVGASMLPGGIPVFHRVLESWPLRRLGLVSYGLYLWHWPVYLVFNEVRTHLDGVTLLALRVGITLALATASYLLVEHRIRLGAPRGWLARWAIPVSMTVITALTLSATARAVDVEDLNVAARRVPASTVVGAPTVLYVGDSVAGSLAEYPIADPEAYGINAIDRAIPGCGLIYEHNEVRGGVGDAIRSKPCTQTWPELVAKHDPDAVVVLFGVSPVSKVAIKGSFRSACDPEYRAMFRERLTRRVEVLGAGGAKVALLTVLPNASLFRTAYADANTECVNEVIAKVAADGPGEVIDLAEFVCPAGRCRQEFDGEPTRPDSIHFNGPGGAVPARWLVEQVRRLIADR